MIELCLDLLSILTLDRLLNLPALVKLSLDQLLVTVFILYYYIQNIFLLSLETLK